MMKRFFSKKAVQCGVVVLLTLLLAAGIIVPSLTINPSAASTHTINQDTLGSGKTYGTNGTLHAYTVSFSNAGVGPYTVNYSNYIGGSSHGSADYPTAYFLGAPTAFANGSFTEVGPALYSDKAPQLRIAALVATHPTTTVSIYNIRQRLKSIFWKGGSWSNNPFSGSSSSFPVLFPTGTSHPSGTTRAVLSDAIDNATLTEFQIASQAAVWHFSQGWNMSGASITGETISYARVKAIYDASVYAAEQLSQHEVYGQQYHEMTVQATAPTLTLAEGASPAYFYGPFTVNTSVLNGASGTYGNIFLELNNTFGGKVSLVNASFAALPTGSKYLTGTPTPYITRSTSGTDIYIKIDDPNPHDMLGGLVVTATSLLTVSGNTGTQEEAIVLTAAGKPDLLSYICSCKQASYSVTKVGIGSLVLPGIKTANATFANTDFGFSVYEITQAQFNSSSTTFPKTSTQLRSAGKLTGTATPRNVWFNPILYTSANVGTTYYYAIVENASPSGWNANAQVFYRAVTITKNETTGVISAVLTADAKNNVPIAFDNVKTSVPTSTTATFGVKKTVVGTNAPATWSFEATLYNATYNTSTGVATKGTVASTKTLTNGSGATQNFTTGPYTANGTHYYLLEETNLGANWRASRQYLIRVVVSGTPLSAVVSYKSRTWNISTDTWDAWSPSSANSFTAYNSALSLINTHTPPAPAVINGVKLVSGTNPPAKTFTFRVRQVTDLTGSTNTGGGYNQTFTSGAGNWSHTIPSLNEGTYFFKVTEETATDTDWVYDTIAYVVKVVVKNGNAAIYYPDGTVGGGITTGESQAITIEPENVASSSNNKHISAGWGGCSHYPQNTQIPMTGGNFWDPNGTSSAMYPSHIDSVGTPDKVVVGAAYCLDYEAFNSGSMQPYYDYAGFAAHYEANYDEILWVLRNGFMSSGHRTTSAWSGTNNLAAMRTLTGNATLTADQAYSATQFALWHFANDINWTQGSSSGYSKIYTTAVYNAYVQLRDKALAAKATGEIITELGISTHFDISAATLNGNWYGPVKLKIDLIPNGFTDLSNIPVTVSRKSGSSYTVSATASGGSTQLTNLHDGDNFYVNISSIPADGIQELVEATATVGSGPIKDVLVLIHKSGNQVDWAVQAIGGVSLVTRPACVTATAKLFYGATKSRLTFKNRYDFKPTTGDLQISKVVADTSDNTAFTYTVKNSSGTAVNLSTGGRSVTKTGGTGTLTATNLSQGKFTITRNTTVLVSGLTPGTYQVTEDATGYTITYKVNGGSSSAAASGTATATGLSVVAGGTAKVEFTNVKNPTTGSLKISKVVADTSDNTAFTYTIKNNSGTVINLSTGGRTVTKAGGTGTLTTTTANLTLGKFTMTRDTTVLVSGLTPGTYRITEDATGYTITYKVNGGSASTGVTETSTTSGLSVAAGGTTIVEFTNVKLPTKGNLQISKILADTSDKTAFTYTVKSASGATVPLNAGGVSIAKTGGSGTLTTTSANLTLGKFTMTRDITVLISGLTPGTYQVTEDATGYTITYKVNGGSASTGMLDAATATGLSVAAGGTTTVEFTNVKYGSLQISKVVADTTDKTAFTFTVKNSSGTAINLTLNGITVTKTGGAGTLTTTTANLSQGKFTMTRDTTVLVKGLPPGTYRVTEDATGYAITYKVGGGSSSASANGTLTTGNASVAAGGTTTMEFTNVKYGSILPEAGGFGSGPFATAAIALSALLFVLFTGACAYRFHKRRRDLAEKS